MTPRMFRVKFYDDDRCWGVEHHQTPEQVAALLANWGEVAGDGERVIIEAEEVER